MPIRQGEEETDRTHNPKGRGKETRTVLRKNKFDAPTRKGDDLPDKQLPAAPGTHQEREAKDKYGLETSQKGEGGSGSATDI